MGTEIAIAFALVAAITIVVMIEKRFGNKLTKHFKDLKVDMALYLKRLIGLLSIMGLWAGLTLIAHTVNITMIFPLQSAYIVSWAMFASVLVSGWFVLGVLGTNFLCDVFEIERY